MSSHLGAGKFSFRKVNSWQILTTSADPPRVMRNPAILQVISKRAIHEQGSCVRIPDGEFWFCVSAKPEVRVCSQLTLISTLDEMYGPLKVGSSSVTGVFRLLLYSTVHALIHESRDSGGKCVQYDVPVSGGKPSFSFPILKEDQNPETDARVWTLLQAAQRQTPIVVLAGKHYPLLPFDMGEVGFVVLGW